MSSSSATTEAAETIAASGNLSGKRTVMKAELEGKLAKGRQTPEGKLDELSEKEKKQIIHENLLAARMRWIKEKAEAEAAATPVSSSAGGSDESEEEEEDLVIERRGITHSLEPAANTRIEKTDDVQVRANRAYSNNSFPNRLITRPPKNPPPSLANSARISSTVIVGDKMKAAQKTPKGDRAKKQSSEGSAATSKMKKLFNFKPKRKKKRKKTIKMTSIPSASEAQLNGERTKNNERQQTGRLPALKSLSDSYLTQQHVSVSISSLDEESSLPVHKPSLGYQNVFDNPDFTKYIQKPTSRSNTSSPSETPLQMKKPKPLPRPGTSGNSLGRNSKVSTGSERDTDMETPPPLHSRITVISPLLSASSNSDSLTPVFTSPQHLEEPSFTLEESLEEYSSNTHDVSTNTKQKLGKAISCNPEPDGFVPRRRGSSQKQKELRRGVCSEGRLEEEEEYIRMSSIITDCSTFENKPQHVEEFLSVCSNLEVPRNSQRLSAAYLKLLPDLLGPTKASPSSTTDKPEEKPKTTKSKRQLHKVKTVPSLGINEAKGSNTSLDNVNLVERTPHENRQLGSFENLQHSSPDLTQNQAAPPTPSKRKFQYTTVTIEAAGKQRKPSAPKKFKYQTVTLSDSGDMFVIPNEDAVESGTVDTPENRIDEVERKTSEQFLHPLLIPSSVGRQSSPSDSGKERRYYINRDSIRMVKNPKDLPTSMLKTVDPETGKVIWHEYVEIDEEEIDQIASSMGVTPSTVPAKPPEKLDVLLEMRSMDSSNEDITEHEKDTLIREELEDPGSATPEGIIEDSDLSCGSTVSSECKYILNLDDPPTIPPRPALLDQLTDHEEVRASGDYSYAFIPGVGARWMMLGGHVSPKTFMQAAKDTKDSCPVAEKATCKNVTPETSPVQPRASSSTPLKQELKVRPPSLPPKTDSLLRETELIKPSKKSKALPFLPPIIVQTMKKSKNIRRKSSDPSEASKLVQQSPSKDSSDDEKRVRKRSVPPKVTPYKVHQEQKRYSGPQQDPLELALESSSHESIPTITLNSDSKSKQDFRKHAATTKPHRKLARQRSYGRKSYKKVALKHKSEHQRQQLKLHQSREMLLNEDKAANNTEMQGTLPPREDTSHTDEINTTEQVETEEAKRARALNKILMELGHLLKNSNFSETDLLGAIETHLKQSKKSTSSNDVIPEKLEEQDRKENSTNEIDEPEPWLSGEEPESEIELDDATTFNSCNSSMPYQNIQIGDDTDMANGNEASNTEESHREQDYEDMSKFIVGDDSSEEDAADDDSNGSSTHSYVNLELGTGMKIYDHDESKRYSYVDLEIESNLDVSTRPSRTPSPSSSIKHVLPSIVEASSQFSSVVTSQSVSDDFTISTSTALHRERSKTSAMNKVRRSLIKPRSGRTNSNPDSDLADAVVAAAGSYPRNSAVQPTPRKNKSLSDMYEPRLIHAMTRVQLSKGKQTDRSLSYQLALQMEDTHLSHSAEVSTSRKRLSAVREEGALSQEVDYCSKSLQRANAVVTKKRQKGVVNSNTGSGMFSSQGGKLTKLGSDVTIEIPEGAVPEGKTQKIWFKVIQRVYDPSADDDRLSLSLSDSISTSQVESLLQEKREKQVQLSPMIVVGPHDAVLEKPIVIRMPHCLPYRNNSWHLQMLGRPSVDGGSEEWLDIINTIGLVQLPPVKSKSKFQNRSSYQMHLDYVQVKTSQLGSFKLVGRPIRNGTYAGKKMVSSVYAKSLPESKCLQVDIFINNAIEDQAQALDDTLTRHGHIPLMRDMPILCFGDGKDMEVTLSNDSNTTIPLGTKSIAFGHFWRSNKVGSSHVMFTIEEDLVEDDRALTLKVQQAGSKLYHETNFLLPDFI